MKEDMIPHVRLPYVGDKVIEASVEPSGLQFYARLSPEDGFDFPELQLNYSIIV